MPGSASGAERPTQLALGDSWAAGLFDGEEGATSTASTTTCLITTTSRNCATSAEGNQLDQAMELLHRRNGDRRTNNDVEVAKVTIGDNDAFAPVLTACATGERACGQTITAVLGAYETNLGRILGGLRSAGGENTDIVATAYDNPLPYCFLSDLSEVGDLLLEGDQGRPGLNDITRSVADKFGVSIAETDDLLEPADWVVWPLGGDCLHPNGGGHEEIKDAFLKALGL
jgi:hypothetical protein